MKRPRSHVLGEESRDALRDFLPKEWVKRGMIPD